MSHNLASKISAHIEWERKQAGFLDNRYSRAHQWRFDGGATVPASSSPHIVPIPMSDPTGVDPEEAFVASLSSCHMLWFLSLAAKQGFIVDRYHDEAVGEMGKNDLGKLVMMRVELRPSIQWGGDSKPTSEQVAELHHLAHEECFIANSVKTVVEVLPQ